MGHRMFSIIIMYNEMKSGVFLKIYEILIFGKFAFRNIRNYYNIVQLLLYNIPFSLYMSVGSLSPSHL